MNLSTSEESLNMGLLSVVAERMQTQPVERLWGRGFATISRLFPAVLRALPPRMQWCPSPRPPIGPASGSDCPRSGPRSIARLGRRLAALAIDWACAVVVSIAFFSYDPLATLAVFAVVQVVFLLVLNGSPGHLILGMRVVPEKPGPLGLWRPFARTALLCLLIPAVIWDRDQRGLHDRLIGTILVRR